MRAFSALLLLAAAACSKAPADAPGPEADKSAIRAVVAGMDSDWNRGDFAGYMAAFKKPDVMIRSPCPPDRAEQCGALLT
jgi:hypothetical protein